MVLTLNEKIFIIELITSIGFGFSQLDTKIKKNNDVNKIKIGKSWVLSILTDNKLI